MKTVVANVLLAASTCAFFVACASTSFASSQAPGLMPWDGLLNALAGGLTDAVAPAALRLGAVAAVVAFALSGASPATRRLARLGLGAALALMAARLAQLPPALLGDIVTLTSFGRTDGSIRPGADTCFARGGFVTRHSSPDEPCLLQHWRAMRKKPPFHCAIRRLRDVLAEFVGEDPNPEKPLI